MSSIKNGLYTQYIPYASKSGKYDLRDQIQFQQIKEKLIQNIKTYPSLNTIKEVEPPNTYTNDVNYLK